jgi:small GTP-binding protein
MESSNSDSQQTTNKKDLQSPFESSNDEENDSDENSSKDGLQIEVLGEQYKEYDNSYKIIVVGNSGVGKSCLSLKATKGLFEEEFLSTMGFEFYSFYIKINKSIVKLQIWDTCGQEVYRSLISNFYRNSSVAILVYAINDRKSFEDIDVWTKQIKNLSSPDCKVFLIGNKADLVDSRKVTKEEGKNFNLYNSINVCVKMFLIINV